MKKEMFYINKFAFTKRMLHDTNGYINMGYEPRTESAKHHSQSPFDFGPHKTPLCLVLHLIHKHIL